MGLKPAKIKEEPAPISEEPAENAERLEELERNFLRIFGLLLTLDIIYLPLIETMLAWEGIVKMGTTIC